MEINSNYMKISSNEFNSPSLSLIEKSKNELLNLLEKEGKVVNSDLIQLKGYQFVVWPNTALGYPEAGRSYAEVETSGYEIQFQYQDHVYVVNIDQEGLVLVSPNFISFSPTSDVDEKATAPSLFELSAVKAKEQSAPFAKVSQVKKYSDMNKEEYYFEIVLDNQKKFKVNASLDDLMNNKIYVGMPFRFLEEKFVQNEPGRSTFTYASLNGGIELLNTFNSEDSHWHPAESQLPIELTEKYARRSGMSHMTYWIKFSDGENLNIDYELYLKEILTSGDHFFKTDHFLINTQDGRVLDLHTKEYDKWIKVTW